MLFFTSVRRALNVNPLSMPVTASENAALEASGVGDPTIRSYFAWRRSSMIFVVIATLLSAGLSTYRQFAEPEGRLDVLKTMAEHFRLEEKQILPALIKAQPKSDEEEEEQEPEADDVKAPAAEEEEEEEEEEEAPEPETTFGQITDAIQIVALDSLPVAALAVVFLWSRFQLTFRIMVAAFAFSFITPLILALCPWSWWGYVEPTAGPQAEPVEYLKRIAEGVLEGGEYLVTLLPTVLSLVPGVQRACIRLKMLLPQSMLPGWFLVVASPFYALFLLVIFVAVNQVDTQPLFFVGMLLFLSAPLCYAVTSERFTRPLTSEEDYRRIRRVQRLVAAMTTLAGVLLVSYLATSHVFGVRLLGRDPATSLLIPLDLVEFLLETISRSMFITVLGADLFMRMNLSAWKYTREFHGTPEAAHYDRVMGEFERIA